MKARVGGDAAPERPRGMEIHGGTGSAYGDFVVSGEDALGCAGAANVKERLQAHEGLAMAVAHAVFVDKRASGRVLGLTTADFETLGHI